MALGVDRVTVARRPRVAVVSTGDELVPPESTPAPGQVRDVNTYTLSALIERAGAVPVRAGLVPDDFEKQRAAAVEGLALSDMLIFSAGSSVSARDMTAQVFASVGEPGVLVHGISFKPGKPTILALLDGKPAIGLPGNPVSAAVVFDMIAAPVVRALMGGSPAKWRPSVRAALARDVPSQTGRQDTVQVSLDELDGVVTAEPVFGSSNLVYTMVRADGHVTVPIDRGGLYAGQEVEVTLY
jgi:molybdopterin molybdotransferase